MHLTEPHNKVQHESLQERITAYQQRVDRALVQHLPIDAEKRSGLQTAMHYAVTNGGKRIRPVLIYATGRALGVPLTKLDVPACAVEMMHAYSLVHDDLPAMDDDDLRRGKPTLHRKFDEATAILAGDALQALAFTMLASNNDAQLPDSAKLRMVAILGDASGADGMAAGQAIDLESVGQQLSLEALESMHRQKTGALIRASVRLSAITAGIDDASLLSRLDGFAAAVGLSFQIVDDILDVIADTETLGKKQGADIARNKPTYPALLGLEGAREHAKATHESALSCLNGLDDNFDELRELSTFIVERSF
ncbi:MAG: farnesyl diphosphate synthase [Granulosicoccus sp.]